MGGTSHVEFMFNCDRINTTNLSSLKCLLYTGSRASIRVAKRCNEYFRTEEIAHNSYGITELGGTIAVDYSRFGGLNSVGQLTSGVSVKVVDINGDRCGPNVSGEICVKMNQPFGGYLNNDKATRRVIDSEDFYLSGDIGHFDDNGNLFIVGRTVEIFKYRDLCVVPSEIENYLILCSEIKSLYVVGIPNETESQLPAAILIREEGSNITEYEVYKMVSGKYRAASQC